MEALFLQLCRMSVSATWMLLAVMAVRPFLKKAPRALVCLLWGLAALRLLVPITVKSRVSLVPAQTALPVGLAPAVPVLTVEAVQKISPTAVLAWVWAAGAVLLAGYAVFSFLRLSRRVQVSLRKKDNIYLCDDIPSPFILGVFRPKIYIPSALTEEQNRFVLAHEQAHLRRGDHLWKPLGYALLCVYWFHPLCWAAYILFCRDMETACDERVVNPMGKQARSAYSAALLECSIRGSMISACPLAFGEVGVKERIQRVLNYRRPAVWLTTASCLLCAVLVCCFLTDPIQAEEPIAAAPLPAESGLPVIVNTITDVYRLPAPQSQCVGILYPDDYAMCLRSENVNGGSWCYVTFENGNASGWVEAEKLDIVYTEVIPALMVAEDANAETAVVYIPANLKTAPSRFAGTVGKLDSGTAVTIHRREFTDDAIWCQVSSESMTGWVRSDCLQYQELPSTLGPVPSASEATPGETAEETDVFSSPSRNAQHMDTLAPGTSITILRRENVGTAVWCCIAWEGSEIPGWINAASLTA